MLILILLLVPAFIIGWMIYLSKKPTNKPWLKPFLSHFDFLKEVYSSISVGFLAIFWWTLYTEIITKNPIDNPTWFLETWILLFILLILLTAFYIRSYFTLISGIISLTIFSLVQFVKWSYDSYYFWLKDSINETTIGKVISPAAGLALFWILINLIYFGGKKLSSTKTYGRTGNLLRALAILTNVVILGILSNSLFVNNTLRQFLSGNSIIYSLPLLTSSIILIIICIYSFLNFKPLELTKFEISLSLIPGFVFLIYSFFPLIQVPENSTIGNNIFILFWIIIFNTLYLSYAIYLINKSNLNHERWLKIYSIILIVVIFLEKLFDIFTDLNFSGIYLTIFGIIIISWATTVEILKRKSLKK